MSRLPDDRTWPYLTVVDWPETRSLDAIRGDLATTLGADVRSLELRTRRDPPLILGRFAAAPCAAALRSLGRLGADAFVATLDDLERMGGTLKIRDLRVENGAIQLDLWRGASMTLPTSRIELLVRAQLSDSVRKAVSTPGPGWERAVQANIHATAIGLAAGFAASYDAAVDAATLRETRTTDKLDLHTTDGLILQIDGDKFGYRALGALRGHGDKANMDRMLELLSHLAPAAIVDPYFPLWTAPPGCPRIKLPGMRLNNEDPIFAFYSRWAAMLYRHVMHAG
jgi:hypothetical protein